MVLVEPVRSVASSAMASGTRGQGRPAARERTVAVEAAGAAVRAATMVLTRRGRGGDGGRGQDAGLGGSPGLNPGTATAGTGGNGGHGGHGGGGAGGQGGR